MAYEDAVKKYIFAPLQMTHSGFNFKSLSNKNKTKGYEIFSGEIKKEAVVYDPPGPFAAGAIYSTVEDLYKYHTGLQLYKLLKKETLNKAYIPYKNNYGYGWMINSYDGKTIVSHSGGASGYRSNFVRITEDNVCIVLLNNTENANVEIITRKIVDILYGKPYKIPFEIKVNKQVLEKYVGTYQITEPPLVMYITVDNGRLTTHTSGQGKIILLAEKENLFFAEEADGFIEFEKGDTGKINKMILNQGGQKFTGNRIYPTWGLLGSATSIGWDGPDIKFVQDTANESLWILKIIKLNKGEIKFRFNNDWNVNYGDNNSDNLLDMYGDNIKVQTGTYDIILDFTDEVKPKYIIIKKR
jgi:hypothetical protein